MTNKRFKVGDKVRIPYINDCNPHNNKIGIITWLHDYNYYPNRNYSIIEKRTQGTITYNDGTTEGVSDFYRKSSGLVSEIEYTTE